MASYSSDDPWSPRNGGANTGTFTPTDSHIPLSPSRYSYTSDSQRHSSDSDADDSMRRILVSPTPGRTRHRNEDEGDDDNSYTDDNSIDEVQDTLISNLDEELDDAENMLTQWSQSGSGSYTSSPYTRPSYSYTTGSPAYTGSPSFLNLPHYSSSSSQQSQAQSHAQGYSQTLSYAASGSAHSSPAPAPPGAFISDSRMARLSKITERTEEPSTRPSSGAYSAAGRPANPTPDQLRRSALLGTGTTGGTGTPSRHSRASTDPSGERNDRTLPPPGRATELISIFETQAQSPGHSRTASAPGFRPASPSARYGSRPSSPSKSNASTSSYGSYVGSAMGSETRATMSSLFSPPSRPFTTTGTRTGTGTGSAGSYGYTGSYASPGTQTQTPFSTFSNTLSQSDTRTGTEMNTETGATTFTSFTPTPSSFTPTQTRSQTLTYATSQTRTPTTGSGSDTTGPAALRRPQTSPRSPLASVRNIVALWKERSPGVAARSRESSASPEKVKEPEISGGGGFQGGEENFGREEGVEGLGGEDDDQGLFGIRRRVQRAGARLRERESLGSAGISPVVSGVGNEGGNGGGNGNGNGNGGQRDSRSSTRSGRSGVLPPGFDLGQFSPYTQSEEPPLHIGLLWYLNVHASPPYRWQRCQALLYPHMLLLSWLSSGGGRGIVALDLLNCTSVVSVPSPGHPSARDDVGTVAARAQIQADDRRRAREGGDDIGSVPLTDILVPFHMVYADGVERLATESLGERSKWVNRLWEVVNRPVPLPSVTSPSITRSPTGSIRTIMSMTSSLSRSSSTASSGTGSRSTIFVPPLSSLPDIQSAASSSSPARSYVHSDVSRRSSLISSHFTRTVDDTVIRSGEEGYIYPGDDKRVITPTRRSRGSLLRRIGSVGELGLDEDWAQKRESKASDEDEVFFSAGSSSASGMRSNVSSTYFSPVEGETWLESRTGASTPTGTRTEPSTFTQSYTQTRGSLESGSVSGTYLTESGTPTSQTISYAGTSPSMLSRTREVRRRTGRAYSSSASGSQSTSGSGSVVSVSASTNDSSDKENNLSVVGSWTGRDRSRSGTFTPTGSDTYTPGSARDSGSYTPTGSGSYRTRSGSTFSGSVASLDGRGSYETRSSVSYEAGEGRSFTESGSGSHTRSYTGSGTRSYTDGGSGSYTEGGAYPLEGGGDGGDYDSGSISTSGSSRLVQRTQISSSETGYDICPSSDFTDYTRPSPYTTETETAIVTPQAASVAVSSAAVSVASDVASEKYVSASQGSSEYLSAPGVASSRASIFSLESVGSFKSLSSIPSFRTAPSISSYRTASEPKLAIESEEEFETCPSEVDEIPSEQSTPRVLSSLGLREDDQEVIGVSLPPSVEVLPSRSPSVQPSRFPSLSRTRSSSMISDLLPQDIPLPASVHALSPAPSPLPITEESESVLTPSSIRVTSETRTEPSSEELPREATPVPAARASTARGSTVPSLASTRRSGSSTETEGVEEVPDESFSLVSSVPPSLSGSRSMTTSVLTPSSLGISSGTTAETIPPATPRAMPTSGSPSSGITATPSMSESTVSSTVDLSSFTQTSSSLPPPSPRQWASTTNVSYESSVLQPSPSVMSLALHDGLDTSFETSFLRPSGSASSWDRLSTIPPSSAPSLSVRQRSPLQPLTPVPALPESLDSESDAVTPTSLSSLSIATSSSLGRTPSTYSSTSSQSSLSSYIFDSRSLLEEEQEPEVQTIDFEDLGPEPSTEPSLLTTPLSSERIRTITASPTPSPRLVTPEGSMVVSITTPRGSVQTEQSSLRTIQSESTSVTERDLGRDMDRLVDELRRYDNVRGLENQDLADNVRALRDELRDLSEFLHRTPSPSQPPQVVAETPRRVVQLVDQVVGGSSIVSSLRPVGPRQLDPAVTLSRNASSTSSIGSYLSSHHSDDDILEQAEFDMMDMPLSPQMWQSITTSETEESTDYDSSPSSSSSPPIPPISPSPSSISNVTVRQTHSPPDLLAPLSNIREQLAALWDGQNSANRMLDELRAQDPPPDHTGELADRLTRIEDLIRNLIDQQGHPRAPQVIFQQPRSDPSEGSLSDSTTSQDRLRDIDRLRQILQGMAPSTGVQMPTAVPATSGPPLAAQLDDILSMGTTLPAVTIQGPPQLIPFVYRPAERRMRSTSPLTIDSLPPRPWSEPRLSQADYPDPRQATRREAAVRRQPSDADSAYQPRQSASRRQTPIDEAAEQQVLRDQRRDRDERQHPPSFPHPQAQPPQFHGGPGPTPMPIPLQGLHEPLPPRSSRPARPPTAPADLGSEAKPLPESWYRQPSRDRTQGPHDIIPPTGATTQAASRPATQTFPQQPTGPTYLPMPSGPTVVQVPLFDSLMDILRENRLAQLATVDQQRELMRYMRGLNEWLERDVHDRQNELRGVVARVDQLRDEVRNLQQSGSETTTETSDTPTVIIGGMPQPTHFPPQAPGFPIGFHPYPPGQVVIPPVVPQDHRTPPGPFAPVIPGQQPTMQQQPPIIIHQPGVPVIPTMGAYGQTPSRLSGGRQSRTDDPIPFIPPPPARTGSTGTPRPPTIFMPPQPMHSMGQSVVHVPASTISSSTDSRGTSRDRGRHGRSHRSRTHSPSHRTYTTRRSRSPRSGRSRSGRRSRRTSYSSSRSRTPPPVMMAPSQGIPMMMTPSQGIPMTPMGIPHTAGMIPQSAGMIPTVVQDPHGHQPTAIHVVSPSTAASGYRPSSPRYSEHHPQQQQPTIVIQQPPQQPVQMMPPPSPMMPQMTGVVPTMMQPPMMTVPSGSYYPPPMTGMTGMTGIPPPMIIQGTSRSRSSSRSRRSRRSRRRSRTPPPVQQQPVLAAQPTAPIIISGSRRSRSRSRSPRRYEQAMMPPAAPVTLLPSGVGFGQPPIAILPQRSSSSRSRRRRSRSRSPSRPQVLVQQPTAAHLPTMYPPQMTATLPAQPQVILPAQPFGQVPVILPTRRSYSRSRSRSPRQQPAQIIMPPQQPTVQHHRSRSRSRSPRRRSRSRSPRPQVITQAPPVVLPSGYTRTRGSRSPPRVEVIGDPSRRRYSRSPRRRYHSRSPSYHDYERDRRRRRPHSADYGDYDRPRYHHPRSQSAESYERRREYSPRRREYSPRRREYSPRRREYSPRRRDYSPRGDRRREYSPHEERRRPSSPRSASPSYDFETGRPRPRDPGRRRHTRERSTRHSRSPEYHDRPDSPTRHSRLPTRRSRSPRRHSRSPTRLSRSPRRHSRSPTRLSRSPRRHSRSPTRLSRSPRRHSRSPTRRSRSPRRRSRSPSRRSHSRTARSRSPTRYHTTPSRATHSPIRIAGTRTHPSSRSPSPTRIPARTHTEHGDAHGRPQVMVTVPSRRPPTVMTLEPEPDDTYTRRTSRRPSGTYALRPSHYEHDDDDEEHEEPVHRTPEGHPIIPIPRSDRRHSPSPERRPHFEHADAPSEERLQVPPRIRTTSGPQPTSVVESEAATPIPARTHPTDASGRVSPIPAVIHPSPTHPYPRHPTTAPSRARTPADRHATATPFPFGAADDERERLEQLNEVALRLHDAALAAQEAEDQREGEFRQHEEDREHIFLDNEERRNQEARARADGIWQEIDHRLAALPPPQAQATPRPATASATGGSPPPIVVHEPSVGRISTRPVTEHELEEEGVPHRDSDRFSISTIRQAASQHASDILETIRLEREEFAREREEATAERERILADAAAEREKILEARDERIRALEDELSKVKEELENEKEMRLTEGDENRAREQQAALQRDENIRNQLGDITDLVQLQRDECERKKELMEERWGDKLERRQTKDFQMLELREMMQKLHDDMAADRDKAEQERANCATKPDLERVIDELQKQTNEQRQLLEMFSESWRADCARHHEETLEVVRNTANEQVPFNVEGYLNEFSKALATEVRMLLGEVGKLREDRRALQHELGYLLCMKSKYGPGGEFDPEWKPPPGAPGGPPADEPPPPPTQPDVHDVPMAKPGWRITTKKDKSDKKKKKQQQQQQRQQSAAEQQQIQAAQAAHAAEAASHHGGQPLPRRPAQHYPGPDPRQQVQSWATWMPDPASQPSPVSVEPTLQVPDRRSPGLFGPRSSTSDSIYARIG